MKTMIKKRRRLLTTLIFYFSLLSILSVILFVFVNQNIVTFISDKLWEFSNTSIDNYINVLEKGEFDKLPEKKLFGDNGYYDILDENLNTIYSSKEVHTYSPIQIKYIYNIDDTFYSLYTLNDNIRLIFKPESNDEEYYYVINEKNEILSTDDKNKPTHFSQEELDLIYKYHYSTDNLFLKEFTYNNKKHYLIALEAKVTETYSKYDIAVKVTFAILSIIYISTMVILVYILNKKINRPLYKLKKAIMKYETNIDNINVDDQDISELYEITKQFNILTNKLKKMDSIKKQYEEDRQIMLANISHDLKTPITIIQGYSKAIIDGIIKGDDIIKKNKTIYDKTVYLNELVNTFHEFSKLDHPEFSYDFKNTDMSEYIREYLVNKYDDLESHKINLDIDIPETAVNLMIDKNHFKRVLENIINNAVKYNEDGISIKIFLNKSKLIIANSGNKIDKKIIREIFKPFSMADESRGSGGSGLGLAIVKKIVDDHNFKISLDTSNNFYKVSFVITFK